PGPSHTQHTRSKLPQFLGSPIPTTGPSVPFASCFEAWAGAVQTWSSIWGHAAARCRQGWLYWLWGAHCSLQLTDHVMSPSIPLVYYIFSVSSSYHPFLPGNVHIGVCLETASTPPLPPPLPTCLRCTSVDNSRSAPTAQENQAEMQLPRLLVSAVAISAAAAVPQGQPAYHGSQARSVEPDALIGIPNSGTSSAVREDTSTIAGLNNRVFAGQCQYMTLGGHGKHGKTTLDGQCVDSKGTWWRTSLNLNLCVANRAGALVYDEQGHFDSSCRPCIIADVEQGGSDDILLKCNCLDATGMPRLTKLQMGFQANDALAVIPNDGRLVCGNHQGDVNPVF
ncbi:Uncharacterized protein TPAR_01427, partial [Tolypocladium paradoxum]